MIKQKTTLMIKLKKKFEISFLDENGNLLITKEFLKDEVASYEYSKPSTNEWKYTFLGWSKTKDGEVLSDLKVSQNQTYYAVLNKEKQIYTVSFDSMGGSNVSSITKEYGEKITKLDSTQKDGYHFVCWCTDKDLKNKVVLPLEVNKDITLYALFNVKVKTGEYLETLLNGYELNPYRYIPESMLPNNHLGNNDLDFSQQVDINKINYNEFGEQWNMIITNINESFVFFNSL